MNTGYGVSILEANSHSSPYTIEELLIHPYDLLKGKQTHGSWVHLKNEPGVFILDLGEATQVDGIELQNIRFEQKERHAKEVKVYLSDSENGPWHEIMSEVLPDTRNDEEDLPILHFATTGQTLGQYLKCEILSHYGTYGGLDYFGLYSGNILNGVNYHARGIPRIIA